MIEVQGKKINIIGIIPARGGSKGIPKKNIKSLAGQPLIAYTIIEAQKSKFITDTIVSSDSQEILNVARKYNVQTLKRPDYLATDSASSIDAVIHAVKEAEKINQRFYDYVIMLQPTTPLRKHYDIDRSLEKLITSEADSIISVVKSPGINPEWMKYIIDGKLVDIESGQTENAPRQKKEIYIRNGAIYAVKKEILINRKTFKGDNCLPYIMPLEQWINIDNISDWEKAEKMLSKHENSYKKGSVKEFDDSWKEQIRETRQNYYTSGHPTNQIMMSFKNQWQVYKSFIGPIMSGMKVLEPGSGRGSISCYFAANGFDCYLLDTSQEVLEAAKGIFDENNLKANYICDDALNMPFQDSYFDVIVHCGLLEHFEDYQKALEEQYRVLAPGGIIIANIVPEKFSIQKAFKFINDFLTFSYKLLSQLKLVKKVNKTPKKSIYRSNHGSQVYVDALKNLGAKIEYQAGIFPVPSLSYSPQFPFSIMSPKIERFLVWLWYRVLDIRRLIWPGRHPWMCSEKWGQHILVVARKPKLTAYKKKRYSILNAIGPTLTPQAKEILSNLGDLKTINQNQSELEKEIVNTEILVMQLGVKVDKKIIDLAKNLKIIAVAATGLDHIDTDYVESRGIKIIGLKNETEFLSTITSTAELAFGLIIDLLRFNYAAFQSVKNYLWQREKFRGHSLQGQTLGILGLGRLGKMVARYGNAFKMNVIACDPYIEDSEFEKSNAKKVNFQELIERSDILTIHVHLNNETENLFNQKIFDQMKKNSYLINTSRGKIINEKDLVKALELKKIAGYATDNLSDEQSFEQNFSNHPLVEYAKNNNNCIILPHTGGTTYESRQATDIFIAKKISEILLGG